MDGDGIFTQTNALDPREYFECLVRSQETSNPGADCMLLIIAEKQTQAH